jgi:hypothetical protein
MIGNAFWARVLRICRRAIAARQLALPAPKTTAEGDPEMPSTRVNKMIRAGKLHLQGHPTMPADDYSVKVAMKVAVSDYTAAEQMEAVGALRVEFQQRHEKAAPHGGQQ